jgi:hypothetical protein
VCVLVQRLVLPEGRRTFDGTSGGGRPIDGVEAGWGNIIRSMELAGRCTVLCQYKHWFSIRFFEIASLRLILTLIEIVSAT